MNVTVSTTMRPYEGSGDSQQSPYEPGRMDNDEHLKVFLQSVGREERQKWCKKFSKKNSKILINT